jgi:hypothetical protein
MKEATAGILSKHNEKTRKTHTHTEAVRYRSTEATLIAGSSRNIESSGVWNRLIFSCYRLIMLL